MNTNISYEIVDLRKIEAFEKMGPVAILTRIPGGMAITSSNNRGLSIDLRDVPDEEYPIEDHEAEGRLVVHTADGTIVMERLGLANWRRGVLPFVNKPDAVFSRDNEVNEYYYRRIKEGD